VWLHEAFPGIERVRPVIRPLVEPRALPYGEQWVLALLVRYLAPKSAFEIGTFTGASTMIIAQNAARTARIHTLDLPPGHKELALAADDNDPPEHSDARIGERFRGTPHETKIQQHYGDSHSFDYTPYARSIDFVFVDGSHSYEYVLSDSDAALRMLSGSGLVVWDDCDMANPGVVRALIEVSREIPVRRIHATRFAVFKADGTHLPAIGAEAPAASV
jgi:predicted O-methyltransferase YrrM